MENLHNLLVCRHSIRKYTDQQVKPEDVQLILEAALLSPTSKSSRSWQFIVVEDKGVLVRMSECKPAGAMPLKGCAFAVVVCADPAKSDAWIEDASIAAEMMQLQAADLGIGSCWIQIRDRYASGDNTGIIRNTRDITCCMCDDIRLSGRGAPSGGYVKIIVGKSPCRYMEIR